MEIKAKVNYRVTNNGEVIAVFFGKQGNNKFMCYSLYDGMFFDADENYLRNKTRNAKGYRINELNAFVANRGIIPAYCSKMVYK